MALDIVNVIFAMGPAPGDGKQVNPLAQIVPLVLLMVVFWFVLIRPQQKKAKEHTQMLTKLKAGDKVVTSSGIVGTVTHVKDKLVTVRTAGDTKLEFTKSAIAEITESSGDSSAS
jgi:preprotein translocase subunit YajC